MSQTDPIQTDPTPTELRAAVHDYVTLFIDRVNTVTRGLIRPEALRTILTPFVTMRIQDNQIESAAISSLQNIRSYMVQLQELEQSITNVNPALSNTTRSLNIAYIIDSIDDVFLQPVAMAAVRDAFRPPVEIDMERGIAIAADLARER